jgi:hypothetical protein
MTDRILSSAWWLVVMAMICAAATAGLFIGYRGLFELLAQRWDSGIVGLLVAIACAAGAMQLCRHRNDLL